MNDRQLEDRYVPPQPHNRRDFRIAIICALPLEAEMVELVLDLDWSERSGKKYGKAQGDKNAYTTGVIAGQNIVLAYMPGAGSGDAAAVAAGLRSSFPGIEFAFVVGICGVVPKHPLTQEDIVLGDCIVSTSVVQYDYGRRGPAGFQRKSNLDSLGRASTEVRAITSKWMTRNSRKQLTKRLAEHLHELIEDDDSIQHPGIDQDHLFPPSYIHKHHGINQDCDSCRTDLGICDEDCDSLGCDLSRVVVRSRPHGTQCQIHFGSIGSANTVMKSGEHRDALSKADNLVAFEMEGSGVWDAFPGTIIVKSACDYADSHKDKKWQRYAAATAAAGLKAILNKLELSDHEINPQDRTVIDVKESVKTEHELKELDMKCLQTFYLQPSYRDTKERTPDRIEGTCNWFLSHKDYQHWADAQEGCLLVSADPGCGKSVLAKYLIDQVLPKSHPDATICYYFFKEQMQDKLAPALCAILHQLFFSQDDGLRAHAVPVFEKIGTNIINDTGNMSDIICKVVDNATTRPLTLLVLDALDEIEQSDCRKLFYLLNRLEKISTIKILLTSRPYDQVIMDFDPASFSTRLHIPGEQESEAISTEVSLVVKDRLQKLLLRKRINEQQFQDLQEKLLAETHRTYLFVHLLFDVLETGLKPSNRELNKFFESLPRSVNEAYTKILNRFADNSDVRKLVRQTFSILLAAERPLTIREMQCAVKVQTSPASASLDDLDLEDDETFAHKLRNWCGLFIQIFNGKVTFIHQTAREFLLATSQMPRMPLEHDGQWGGTFSIEQSHVTMAHICVSYLSLCDKTPKENNSRILIPDVSEEWYEADVELPFLSYAAEHWDLHFDRGRISDEDLICEQAFKLCDPSYDMARVRLWLSFTSRLDFQEVNPISAGLLVIVPSLRTNALMPRLLSTFKADTPPSFFIQGLCIASQYGHVENVRALLDYSDSSQKGESWSHGRAPMHYAIIANRADVIKLLLQAGSPVNGRNLEGQPYLHHAVQRYVEDDVVDNEIISTILEFNPDIAAVDDDQRKENALHYAIRYGASRALVLLLERGADVHARSSTGETPLHIASYTWPKQQWSTYEALVLRLLKHGALLDAQDDYGYTPIHSACHKGIWSISTLLLEHGAKVGLKATKGSTPLHLAIKCRGDSRKNEHKEFIEEQQNLILKLLEHGADPNAFDDMHSTPLHYAVECPNPKIVGMLIGRGADIEARDEYGKTPLLRVIAGEHGYATALLLLVLGADVRARDQLGRTAKYYALTLGNNDFDPDLDLRQFLQSVIFLQYNTEETLTNKLREVKSMLSTHTAALDVSKTSAWELVEEARQLLVKCSSCVDLTSMIYATSVDDTDDVRHCLHLAAQSHFYSWVETLLDLGFDPNFSNGSGSPLHYAATGETVESLLRYGAEVNARDDLGRTPIHYVAAKSETVQSLISLMIRQGANVNALDHVQATPLHMAVMYGSMENIKYLLKAGADPKLQDAYGFTALSIAAARPLVDVVALLLRNGASTITSKIEANPLYCAAYTGMFENVQCLLKHGVAIQTVAKCIRLLISEKPSEFVTRNLQMLKSIIKHHAHSDLFKLLRIMLRSDADCTDLTVTGTNLLNYALRIGDEEAAIYLLRCGVNCKLPDPRGGTPLHIAVSVKYPNLTATRFLIWYGSDVDSLDHWSTTPLYSAVFYGSWSNTISLLRSGANPNIQREVEKRTPLHIASAGVKHNIIYLLRRYGADPMLKDREGYRPEERYNQAVYTKLVVPPPQTPMIGRRHSMVSIGNDRKYCPDVFKTYVQPIRRESVHFPLVKSVWPSPIVENKLAPSHNQKSRDQPEAKSGIGLHATVPLPSERSVDYNEDLLKNLRAPKNKAPIH